MGILSGCFAVTAADSRDKFLPLWWAEAGARHCEGNPEQRQHRDTGRRYVVAGNPTWVSGADGSSIVTAAVDPDVERLIQKLIREDFAGKTVITIAHRLDTIVSSPFNTDSAQLVYPAGS